MAIALLCSWVLSLTMTPLLCVTFLRPKPRASDEAFDGPVYRAYRGILAVEIGQGVQHAQRHHQQARGRRDHLARAPERSGAGTIDRSCERDAE